MEKKKGYLLCLFRISLDLVGYVCIYVTAICLRVFLPEGAKDDVFAKRFSRSSAVMQHPQIYDIYIYTPPESMNCSCTTGLSGIEEHPRRIVLPLPCQVPIHR